ncbi:MAG: hypothetical protein K2I60_00520, partial [Oscillospiraceae bacterium]|nr:hypothetical protein [Oscillospiraceae bacterium]
MKINNQLGKIKMKKLMSVVLTASIIVTSFSSLSQISAQAEEDSSQAVQVAAEDGIMQTAAEPKEFVINSKYDLSKFMIKYDY